MIWIIRGSLRWLDRAPSLLTKKATQSLFLTTVNGRPRPICGYRAGPDGAWIRRAAAAPPEFPAARDETTAQLKATVANVLLSGADMLLFHASLVQHDRAPFEGAKMRDSCMPLHTPDCMSAKDARRVRLKRG
jgi:hypothetical protein